MNVNINSSSMETALTLVVNCVAEEFKAEREYQLSASQRRFATGKASVEYKALCVSTTLKADAKSDLADVRENAAKRVQEALKKGGLTGEKSKEGKLIKPDYNLSRAEKQYALCFLITDAMKIPASVAEKLHRTVRIDWRDGGNPAFSTGWEKEAKKLVEKAIANQWTAAKCAMEVEKSAAKMSDPEKEAERQLRAERLKAEKEKTALFDAMTEATDATMVEFLSDEANYARFSALLETVKGSQQKEAA